YKDEVVVMAGITHYELKLKDAAHGMYILDMDDEIVRIEK
ncbi:MAG: hypothetical protein JWN78_1038, partial [Bacteroidota bacterium]|nr:hypothetical protein [Bacteroidota bacterium]